VIGLRNDLLRVDGYVLTLLTHSFSPDIARKLLISKLDYAIGSRWKCTKRASPKNNVIHSQLRNCL